MKYLIEDIQRKATLETRTDGKYPDRIGSIVTLKSNLEVGSPLYFEYIQYNNGEEVEPESHITRTSIVDDYDIYSKEGYLIIYTRNSIYYFKEIDDSYK